MRDKNADAEAACTVKKHRASKLLLALALGALIGYFFGFTLPEEKRSRLGKLMYEGREMWFRIFV